MKQLWKIVRVIFFAIFLTIIAGILYALIYGKEITNILVEEINKQLSAKIEVENINFSLLKKFPDAALEFNNITVYSPQNNIKQSGFETDTLLQAEKLFLQFNITDLINKNYIINKTNISNGDLRLEIINKNKKNFVIWKTKIDTISSKVKLKLEDVRFTNINTKYYSKKNRHDFKFFINRLKMTGDLSENSGEFSIKSDLYINDLIVNKKHYLKNKDADLSLSLSTSNNNFKINDGLISLSGLDFIVAGEVFNNPEKRINLSISGNNLDAEKFISMLPANLTKSLKNYDYKGYININSVLSGSHGPGKNPHFEAKFLVFNGELKKWQHNISMKINNASGSYSNGKNNNMSSSVIKVEHYDIDFGKNNLQGNISLTGFPGPFINLHTTGEINFAELVSFLSIKKIEKGTGKIYADINFTGKLSESGKDISGSFNKIVPDGSLELKNVSLKTKGSIIEFNNTYGTINFDRNVMLKEIKMNIGDYQIQINGKVGNLLSQFPQKTKPLIIEASVSSDHFNPSVFLDSLEKDNRTETGKSYLFPDSLYLDLTLDIGQLDYKKFSASDFKGVLMYKPRMLNLNSVTFKSMKGEFSGSSVVFQNINRHFLTKTQSNLDNININDLFHTFNNFGQEFITDKNVNGNITGEISFSSRWTNNLQIIKKDIITESFVKINDGELINFEPMLGLAKYINVSELKHIHFSELVNKIIIQDEKITIPQMDINSSAFNISLSGIHYFDNHFSYNTKVLLSEVLAGRAKQTKIKQEDFGKIEDDGLGRTSLYLSIEGNPDNYKVTYDKKAALQKVKNDLQNERIEIKNILREELGLFRKDSITNSSNDQENKKKFNIIWDEIKTDSTKTDTSSGKGFGILWEENDSLKIK